MNGCCDWVIRRSRFSTGRRICGVPAVVERNGKAFCHKHDPEVRARYAENQIAKAKEETRAQCEAIARGSIMGVPRTREEIIRDIKELKEEDT